MSPTSYQAALPRDQGEELYAMESGCQAGWGVLCCVCCVLCRIAREVEPTFDGRYRADRLPIDQNARCLSDFAMEVGDMQ